ncbi:MAG: hypothetical protein JJT81_05560 [Rubellimicrobium sp.]|nr:hypothetical protein [Rubellimicrobium sp.]
MSDMALSALLRRMKRGDITTHGFRSSFRDWSSDAAHAPFEVCEAALAHAPGSAVVQAYARSDLFERRRELLQRCGVYCAERGGPLLRVVLKIVGA